MMKKVCCLFTLLLFFALTTIYGEGSTYGYNQYPANSVYVIGQTGWE
ncbi:hypothetical protein [Viscerimonas tarda]